MEAPRVYAQKHKMAQAAQDACTRIVVMAERRIGQELIEAQKRGDLSTQGHPKTSGGAEVSKAKLADIGMTAQRAHEFRRMAELDDSDIDEVVAQAQERGRPAAKTDFQRLVAAKRRSFDPPIARPPDHVSYMSLWLRNGVRAIQQFRDHRECLAMFDRHQIRVDRDGVVAVVEFLAALCAAMEADRAA